LTSQNVSILLFSNFEVPGKKIPNDGGQPCCGGGAYELRGSCRFRFLEMQRGGDYWESPSYALRTWLMGVLKSPGIPFRACVRMAFWW